MGNRYFITGVQLGMLVALNNLKEYGEISKLLKKIEDEQFILGYLPERRWKIK